MDALLEAGEEEGILEESDRELVRSVVEFGDKVVREVMTPRPEIFAVPGTLTLQRVHRRRSTSTPSPASPSTPARSTTSPASPSPTTSSRSSTPKPAHRTVAQIQRPAAFVPETKKVAELLREMQREKQHMRIVIDEYGGVAGLVTIEDLLEAIVGNIADEHDEPEADDAPIREPNGAYVVSGSFELSRLRDLFADQFEPRATAAPKPTPPTPKTAETRSPATPADSAEDRTTCRDTRDDPTALRLPEHYESTTLGGLVSEIAGHIPLPGEVVEEDGLRLEVLASTDRRIDRIRVSLISPPHP